MSKNAGRGPTRAAYWDVTSICEDVEPKSMLTVTDAPDVQKVGEVPIEERGALRTKDVCAPGWSVNALVSKVSGLLAAGVPAGPPTPQTAAPPDEMLQGEAQAGAVAEPVLVPAKTTWQVDGVQEIGLPPLFFMEMETAVGEALADAPALAAAPTTTTLELDVALFTRL